MKRIFLYPFFFLFLLLIENKATAQSKDLKLVFIRHAERPENGDNLTCKGLNRSLMLPALLYQKFGKPSNIYIPALKLGDQTKRSRMFQTITPFAVKYNLTINSVYDEEDEKHIGKALLKENGTIIIVWEHNDIPAIVQYLGIKAGAKNWPGNDYDSIWTVTFPQGKAVLKKEKQGLNPSTGCAF